MTMPALLPSAHCLLGVQHVHVFKGRVKIKTGGLVYCNEIDWNVDVHSMAAATIQMVSSQPQFLLARGLTPQTQHEVLLRLTSKVWKIIASLLS